ncbi:MAG: hypothetical protein ACREBW_02390 [Candidatus Micrarchaeaceae archaeon]
MDDDFQRRKFTELRFEYYVSGRTLWFSDTMNIGAMLLGYAVELSLKYALICAGVAHKRLLHGHRPVDLFKKCIEVNAIPGVTASEDLLQYVSDMFNQRYPSQVIETSAEANARGHAIGLSLDVILAYDDLMIQLDDALRLKCSDHSVSIGLLAAHFVNRPQGRGFFHCNVAALKNSHFYREHLKDEYSAYDELAKANGVDEQTRNYNLGNQKQRLATWESAPSSIWSYPKVSTAIGPDFESLQSGSYAKDFVYPGRHTARAV